jgi:hypothetical protein
MNILSSDSVVVVKSMDVHQLHGNESMETPTLLALSLLNPRIGSGRLPNSFPHLAQGCWFA